MVLNIRAMGRQFLCGQVKIASAPRSGIKIIAVIKPTMRREEAARACQWRPRRGTFVFVLSAQPTSCVPGRAMSAAHSGQIQMYLGAVAIGMLALLLLYAWLA